MADINDYIHNPENQHKSPERLDREHALPTWNRELAKKLAHEEQIELTDAHWCLIEYLRDHYLQHGLPQTSHELTKMLDDAFSETGGIKQLYLLFPNGPIAQGSRIAGVPAPGDTKDASYGSVH